MENKKNTKLDFYNEGYIRETQLQKNIFIRMKLIFKKQLY